MAYEIVSELSYDYSEWTGFAGEAGKIEFEVQGIPGLASLIAWACEAWVKMWGLTIEAFAIYQDTQPFFDKYKVYMVFHESPIVWVALVPLIPLLIKAIAALGVSFILWRMTTVIFSPPKPVIEKETIKAIEPVIDAVNKMDIPSEQKATIIKALIQGAGKVAAPVLQWVLLGAAVVGGGLYLVTRRT